MKWLILVAIALVVIAGAGVGVYFGVIHKPAAEPIAAAAYVPEGVDIVAYGELSNIVGDEDFKDLYQKVYEEYGDPSWPASIDAALNQLEQDYGIDLREFSHVNMFGKMENGGSVYAGIIAKGTFDKNALIQSLEEIPGLTQTDYKGYTIYKFTAEGQEIGIAFLDGDTLVAGTLDATKDVIDVKIGDKASLSSGPVYEAYNSLGSLFKVAFALPEVPEGYLPEEYAEEMPDAVGFGLSKSGQTITIEAKAHFTSATAADDAKSYIDVAIGWLKLDPSTPPEVVAILDNTNVSVSDSWLTITSEATITQIEALIDLIPAIPIL